ncbi:Uncharacterised protein [Mycobacteroides abscessus subsp. abscessus]|nr:Uncharacterised protein [Mycobacteroides abscessus subsp. abscessus]SLE05064.1 Uncharacterised protein [Mycobacteroides abscessus subsp. massiliense]
MEALGDVRERGVEEGVDAHSALRHEPDRVHNTIELVALADHLGNAPSQAVQVLLVLHVELQQRGRLG